MRISLSPQNNPLEWGLCSLHPVIHQELRKKSDYRARPRSPGWEAEMPVFGHWRMHSRAFPCDSYTTPPWQNLCREILAVAKFQRGSQGNHVPPRWLKACPIHSRVLGPRASFREPAAAHSGDPLPRCHGYSPALQFVNLDHVWTQTST